MIGKIKMKLPKPALVSIIRNLVLKYITVLSRTDKSTTPVQPPQHACRALAYLGPDREAVRAERFASPDRLPIRAEICNRTTRVSRWLQGVVDLSVLDSTGTVLRPTTTNEGRPIGQMHVGNT